MHPALTAIAQCTQGTAFEGDLFLVGGAVRDELMGEKPGNDFDLVTQGSSAELAGLLHRSGCSTIAPVTYERFGTAMVRVEGVDIEIVTARRESYDESSRKPSVEPASYYEDALRRDFTINTLQRSIHSGEMKDPTGLGLPDLQAKVLRTPLDPEATFFDDPLRMLRAIRFRWRLGFELAEGLADAIVRQSERLQIISAERVRDEFLKILSHPTASLALEDLMQLNLIAQFAPELLPMVGCEQGRFHHLDVWDHTRLVVKNLNSRDPLLALSALLHDIGKPPTRFVDEAGNTRFFGHEAVGAEMARELLRRLKLPQRDVDAVVRLVRNHMRLGSSPTFTPTAARRLIRDLGEQVEPLLRLVEADASSLHPGVRVMDLQPIRQQIEEVSKATPRERLDSPLTGQEIIELTGFGPGQEIGRIKKVLTEAVLDGRLQPGDKETAAQMVHSLRRVE